MGGVPPTTHVTNADRDVCATVVADADISKCGSPEDGRGTVAVGGFADEGPGFGAEEGGEEIAAAGVDLAGEEEGEGAGDAGEEAAEVGPVTDAVAGAEEGGDDVEHDEEEDD